MIEHSEQTHEGVVCLHCGMLTLLTKGAATQLHISLVRCTECGKEAPYLASDIVVLRPLPGMIPRAA